MIISHLYQCINCLSAHLIFNLLSFIVFYYFVCLYPVRFHNYRHISFVWFIILNISFFKRWVQQLYMYILYLFYGIMAGSWHLSLPFINRFNQVESTTFHFYCVLQLLIYFIREKEYEQYKGHTPDVFYILQCHQWNYMY
jgi:hypothetical protein